MKYAQSTNAFYDEAINSVIPDDAVEISKELHSQLLFAQSSGQVIRANSQGFPVAVPAPPPTFSQLESHFTAAIQNRLDEFARTRNYDGILSACTYATTAVPKFKSEGQACVNLRDATWAAAYDILAKVQAGQRPMPTSIADIEADLPAAVWPA